MLKQKLSTMKSRTQKRARILTVQSDIRYGMSYPFKVVPKMRLAGLWLKDAGFNPGDRVHVEVRSRRLILKPLR